MKRILPWIIALAVIVISLLIYRSRSSDLNVTPNAREAIEKAKQR